MKIYFIRHGEADHLKENWHSRLLNRKQFIKKMMEWEYVNLTENGVHQAKTLSKIIPKNYRLIVSSPLPRTKQTANYINIANKKIIFDNMLKEIITSPPGFLKLVRLPIIVWIYICILSSIINGHIFKLINQCREIYKLLLSYDEDIIVVSHTMRIRTLIYFAYFCPCLKVLSTNYKTCGVSVVCKKAIKVPLKEPCNVRPI